MKLGSNEIDIQETLNSDTFVGIHFENGKFEIRFPLGFNINYNEAQIENDKRCREDILLLIRTLVHYRNKDKVNSVSKDILKDLDTHFPIYSYLFIYNYYKKFGYYKVKNKTTKISDYGKINWNKTVKRIKPVLVDKKFIYLETIRNIENYDDNELICKINRFCVYESYLKIGCLFSNIVPKKETLKGNYYKYIKLLNKKIENTFNSQELDLLKNMKKILENESNKSNSNKYFLGTTNFNLIWETMINEVYGIDKNNSKDFLHPHIKWYLGKNDIRNITLKPDTIMIPEHIKDKIYILDAKYYKAGADKVNAAMPGGESILKQIVYAEKFRNSEIYKDKKIYNAFILPYSSEDSTKILQHMGYTVEDWYPKNFTEEYTTIKAIQLDIKYLMENHLPASKDDFDLLINEIESY